MANNLEERLNALKGKQDNVGDQFGSDDIRTLVEGIEYAMSHGGKLDGIYYGQYDSIENLPKASTLTNKGYAYVGSSDPSVYYIYRFDGEGSAWEDSGNKFVTTSLETDLETKSATKAPTTEAVKEGLEAVDITATRSGSTELSAVAKYNAAANINDRAAVVVAETGVVKALGYKVLNPALSFASQVNVSNTVYEIKDSFDLEGRSVTIPANCTLKFNGGKTKNGTLYASDVTIDSKGVCFESITGEVNAINAVNSGWFGNKSSDINKTIALFPAQNVNVYGSVDWDEEIVVPYNSSIIPHNMSIDVSEGSDTLMTVYCDDKDVLLEDCKINVSGTFNGTCFRIIGNGNTNIAGYNSDGNSTAIKIEAPFIYGKSQTYSKSVEAIGVMIDLHQVGGYIYMYFKDIKVSCVNVNTALRIEYYGNGTFNTNRIHLSAWHCPKGFSSNVNISRTNTVDLDYQCQTGDNYPIHCDLSGSTAYFLGTAPFFKLTIWDSHVASSVKIDNTTAGRYSTTATTALSEVHGAETFFVNKPTEHTFTRTYYETQIPYVIIDGTFEIYQMLKEVYTTAVTHQDCLLALVNYTTTYVTKIKSVKYIIDSGNLSISPSNVRNVIRPIYDYNGSIGSHEVVADISIIVAKYKGNSEFCRPCMVLLDVFDATNGRHIVRSYTIGYESSSSYKATSVSLINNNTEGSKGESTQRPVLESSDIGFMYYDVTLKRPLWYNGEIFTDNSGNVIVDDSGSLVERNNIGKINYKVFQLNKEYTELTFTETTGYWIEGATGKVALATGDSASLYSYATIDVENISKLAFVGYVNRSQGALGYYFYDSSNIAISGSGASYGTASVAGISGIILEVPQGAKYLKVTLYANQNKNKFKVFSITNSQNTKSMVYKSNLWYSLNGNTIEGLQIDDTLTFAQATAKYGINIPFFVGTQVQCTDKDNAIIYYTGSVWKNCETDETIN